MESCFIPRVATLGHTARLEEKRSEITLLIKVLDEFSRGRMLEVGDMLGTRLRSLAFKVENPEQEGLAQQFLSYQEQERSFVPNAVIDTALRLEAAEKRRAEKLRKVSRRSRTADR